MGQRRANALGDSDIFKSVSHRRMRAEEVWTLAAAPARIETTSRDEYASLTVPDPPSAVEQSGLFSSERPRSVGVRVATWVALILAGFLLMILSGIGTAAILVDRDCEASYGRNSCE
jgi:hypothetical protein